MKDKKIILLGGHGQSTRIVFNSLNEVFDISLAIVEEKESLKMFLKRRIKKLGLFTVIGQILFQGIIVSLLNTTSKKRKSELIRKNKFNTDEIPAEKLKKVKSVNSIEVIELLKKNNPDLIIINGTRIISRKILQSVACKFINMHAGITPKYRGVHGTYWALVRNDIENSGVTIHFVDEGIDTGNIIAQTKVAPTAQDNFTTYPLLQLSAGVELLNKSIQNYFADKIVSTKSLGESNLFYHPTIWEYLFYRVTRKIK